MKKEKKNSQQKLLRLASSSDLIRIRGAREHNLKNIHLDLPRNKFVVLTGLSGSGKSSLAFDTLYAEGQRRYVESLSAYARQFLGQMEKPDVDSIEGLSPAISIDQKTTSKNPRSTVGTVTEIHDYLRLLYARIGKVHCPQCHKILQSLSVDQIVDQVFQQEMGSRLYIQAPVIRARKGSFQKLFKDFTKQGYVRAEVDGQIYDLEEAEHLHLDKSLRHSISVVVDRFVLREGVHSRLAEAIENACKLANGLVEIKLENTKTALENTVHSSSFSLKNKQDPKTENLDQGEKEERREGSSKVKELRLLFSQNMACPDCGISIGEISPRAFSFNNPLGACPECSGLGCHQHVDVSSLISDQNLSIAEGCISAPGFQLSDENSWGRAFVDAMAKKYHFSLQTPYKDLPDKIKDMLMFGNHGEILEVDTSKSKYAKEGLYLRSFEGIVPTLERRYREAGEEGKAYYEQYMRILPCETCKGARLKPEILAVTIHGKNIHEVSSLSIHECQVFLREFAEQLSPSQAKIASRLLKEVDDKLTFLLDVGLSYMTLARSASTLSGGESQRIRLATQIGSGLMGVLYILDEPSIGLHQRDNTRLLNTLFKLRNLGNTVIVVEHDEETMLAADHIVDIGPLAGKQGGEIVAEGTAEEIMQVDSSITGQYLSGKRYVEVPQKRRTGKGTYFEILGARANNLKNIDVRLPVGTFICVTGVSGSGKSSLVNSILLPSLEKEINGSKRFVAEHKAVISYGQFDKVISIDQSPIGRTPRSNPVTYTGAFDLIRSLFSETKLAKAKGFKQGRFSFNVKGGRCEACSGDGVKRIEMHFLPDVFVECEVCKGKRYNRETLEVKFKEKNIADVLAMTVEEACEFFKDIPKIKRKLDTLKEVGLSYIQLGQSSTTLSGGEAQRIKLANELSKRSTGKTLFILDEPTTGLHIADTHKLIDILQSLTDAGNTVLVIEHNLEVIKTADHILDLGPEGGNQGGQIVCQGTPEEIAACPSSYTGQYLKALLKNKKKDK